MLSMKPYFNSAEMVLNKGLLVIFTLLCYSGVTLAACPPSLYTDLNGTIQSPGFNTTGKYDANMSCTFYIQVSAGRRITLEVKNMSILGSMPNCMEDSLEILVGCNNISIGKFCSCSNLSMPDKIYSYDHCMTLVFKSDGLNEGKGFEAQYTTANNATRLDPQNCSTESVTPSHGTIYSPNWPLEYPESASCVWTFTPLPTTIVRFFFTSFDLDGDPFCDPNRAPERGDQISINGTNTTGGQIVIKKRLCTMPADAFFPINDMQTIEVRFGSNTDRANDGTGVMAGYATYIKGYVDPNAARCAVMAPTTAVPSSTASTTTDSMSRSISPSSTQPTSPMSSSVSPGDGVTLAACPPSLYTDLNGTIQSPGFNTTGKYDANMSCTFNIRVSAGRRITLEFKNLSILGSMPNCTEDSVEIFVGCRNTSIGKFCSCSNVSMPKIYSFDNCMTLVFKSDGSNQGKGFKAQYTTANNATRLDPYNNCSTDSVTPSHGTIYTPNWPLEYPENASCVWTFNPPPTKIVRFFFTSFELDGDPHCDPNRAPEMGDQISINGTNTTGVQIPIKKRICTMPADAFFPIKDMKAIEVRFGSNNDSRNDSTGVMAGYATYIKGYVKSSSSSCALMAPTTTVASSTASTAVGSTTTISTSTVSTATVTTSNVSTATNSSSTGPTATGSSTGGATSSKLSGGEIAGIAIGILAFVGLTAAASCFLYSRCQKTKKASVGTESAYDNKVELQLS